MSLLKTIHPSRILLRSGLKLYKLAPYQLQEILNYQSGKDYNKEWLIVNKNPYFKMSNGYKKKIVYFIDDN